MGISMSSGCGNREVKIFCSNIFFLREMAWNAQTYEELRKSSVCLGIDLIHHGFLAKLKHSISLKSNIFPWEPSAEFFTD